MLNAAAGQITRRRADKPAHVADALEVVREERRGEQVASGRFDIAVIELPSKERTALVDVVFPELGCRVSLPTSARFSARPQTKPGRRSDRATARRRQMWPTGREDSNFRIQRRAPVMASRSTENFGDSHPRMDWTSARNRASLWRQRRRPMAFLGFCPAGWRAAAGLQRWRRMPSQLIRIPRCRKAILLQKPSPRAAPVALLNLQSPHALPGARPGAGPSRRRSSPCSSNVGAQRSPRSCRRPGGSHTRCAGS